MQSPLEGSLPVDRLDEDTAPGLLAEARALINAQDIPRAVYLLSRLAWHFGRQGDNADLASVFAMLGFAELRRERWHTAIAAFRQAARVGPMSTQRVEHVWWLARCHQHLDNFRAARRYSALALAWARRVGASKHECGLLLCLGYSSLEETTLGRAEVCFREALTLAESGKDEEAQYIAYANLAYIANLQARYADAVENARQALRHRTTGEKAPLLVEMVIALAELGDIKQAKSFMRLARRLTPAGEPDLHRAMLDRAQGILLQKCGQRGKAAKLLSRAADGYWRAFRYSRAKAVAIEAAKLKGESVE
jgi:tetratricopeptide (TPR) repeat protein